MTTRWTLTDPSDASVHAFLVNPDPKGPLGEVPFERSVGEAVVTDTGNVMTMTQDKQLASQFGVTVTDRNEYQALWAWWWKHRQLVLADDLGRTATVYLTSFDAKRIRSASAPWHHSIACGYLILALTDI